MSMYGKYPKVTVDGVLVEQKAEPVVDCSHDKVLVVQADRVEADINSIISRFEKAGMVSSINKTEPFYGDVSSFDGLQDAFQKVQDANELFMGMSASIRERFANDPVQMIDFLADEKNREEAQKLGMLLPVDGSTLKPGDSTPQASLLAPKAPPAQLPS